MDGGYQNGREKDFYFEAFDPNGNFSQLFKEFGISTKTGYKWKERFLERWPCRPFREVASPEETVTPADQAAPPGSTQGG